jgi:glycosyltransferase involved in cell wall biosynthesis
MVREVGEAVTRAGVAPGTPVHVMRSTLAPLGLALAEHLRSPWCTLDLDDDDEAVAAAQRDGTLASALHRLVETFGPLFDAVCAADPLEASAIGQRFGIHVSVVRNGVVVPGAFARKPAEPPELLYVGNLTYEPNIQAAAMLASEVAPAVAGVLHRPVNTTLIGHHDPTEWFDVLGQLPGVRLTGYVEDLAPVYERASAVVVPLERGGGTSIKVLEAFARGVPVVSTRAGVRGLGAHDGTHVLLGENPTEIADAVVGLIREPERGAALARAARELVESRYAAPLIDDEVSRFLLAAAGRSTETPAEVPSAAHPDLPVRTVGPPDETGSP